MGCCALQAGVGDVQSQQLAVHLQLLLALRPSGYQGSARHMVGAWEDLGRQTRIWAYGPGWSAWWHYLLTATQALEALVRTLLFVAPAHWS